MTPDSARNIDFVGAHDLDGRGDSVQIMVHKGHAFIGHMFADGFTVVDVARPAEPADTGQFRRRAAQYPRLSSADPWRPAADGQFAEHLGDAGLLRPQRLFQSLDHRDLHQARQDISPPGLRVFDISKPAEPREIAFMPVDGLGLHRLWYVGGRYAYASCHWQGFTDHVLAIIDMQEPTRPEVVGRWWLPGMHTGRRRDAELGGQALCAASRDRRRQPRLCRLARRRLHDPRCRRPDRAEAAVATATGARRSAAAATRRCRCPAATSRSSPTRAISTIAPTASSAAGCSMCASRPTRCRSSTFPTPAEEDYCAKGAKFGPHNLHENRPGLVAEPRS